MQSSDDLKPQHAAMTDDLNNHILNLKPSVPPSPMNEPYKLTFVVENETDGPRQLQMTEFTDDDDDDVVVESFETPSLEHAQIAKLARGRHDSNCILSAFLYFITITTFAYLFILWVRQRMHVQMELMHWW